MYAFKSAAQPGRGHDDDVIETLASNGADEPFDIGILPRRARRREDFVDPMPIAVAATPANA